MKMWSPQIVLILVSVFSVTAAKVATKTKIGQRIAIVGAGVIGLSSALAILERDPSREVTIFYDLPLNETLSYYPAGLFRLDDVGDRTWGKASFNRFASLNYKYGGAETGVQMVSGHIISQNESGLKYQEKSYGDIVYNFRYLSEREMRQLVPHFMENKSDPFFGIHYTAYTTEGRKYTPWLKAQLLARNVTFIMRTLENLDEIADDFDVIINCAGINGGKLAQDGDVQNMYPIRGILFEVDANWQKHFFYREYRTYAIPTTTSLYIGGLKQDNNRDTEIHETDRKDIWDRYLELHPALKGVTVLNEFCLFRPGRHGGVRLEKASRTIGGRSVLIVHNYGHGGNGFTKSWGCAENVADIVLSETSSLE